MEWGTSKYGRDKRGFKMNGIGRTTWMLQDLNLGGVARREGWIARRGSSRGVDKECREEVGSVRPDPSGGGVRERRLRTGPPLDIWEA